jgi:hypothetical protein
MKSLVGADHVQVFGSAKHADKFTINPELNEKWLVGASDARGEVVAQDQLLQMAGGEDMAFRGMQQVSVGDTWSPAVIIISNEKPAWLTDASGATENRLFCEVWEPVIVDRSTDLGDQIKDQIQPLLALLLKSYHVLRDHVKDVPAMDWDFEPMRRWMDRKPAVFTSFLRCGEFTAADGNKYVLTFTPDDATAVPEAQEIFKLYLEAKRKPDDGSGNTDRILASIETIDALSMPTTGKIRKCHECQEVVAADGEESNCTDDCETQCPGGAWLAKYANYRVGKDSRTNELFNTSWAFGTTPGAPPLKIKGLRIDKETLAGSMMPEQEDDA